MCGLFFKEFRVFKRKFRVHNFLGLLVLVNDIYLETKRCAIPNLFHNSSEVIVSSLFLNFIN